MTILPGLKARLIDSNDRERDRREDFRDVAAARQARDEAVAAEAARQTASLIADAILASAPPPRAHFCEQPEWCLWCARPAQAQVDAAIAREIGGAA